MIGIILNLLLFTGKFIAGKISGSVSITADAFNNLTDAGTVLLSIIGIKTAEIGPGTRHPNGHGKYEWIFAMIASLSVLLVGWELGRDSIEAIKNPQNTVFSYLALTILLVSICVKLFLYFYNMKKSKQNDLLSLKAVAIDSLSDAFSTGAVVVSVLLNHFFGWKLDGYFGLAVSILIIYNALKSFFETVGRLSGEKATEEEIENLKCLIKSECPIIGGIYDLQIEDYGHSRRRAIFTLTPKENSTASELLCYVPLLKSEIYNNLKYLSCIEVQNSIKLEEQQTICNNVEELLKKAGFIVSLDEFRVIYTRENHIQINSVLVVEWENLKEFDALIDFVKDPINVGLSKYDSTYFTTRISTNNVDSKEKHRKNRSLV